MTDVDLLARCLAARDPDGRRTAVPVYGNGLNVQAFAEANDPTARNRDSVGTGEALDPWTIALGRLLERLDLAARSQLRRIPPSHQGWFDELEASIANGLTEDVDRPNPEGPDDLDNVGTARPVLAMLGHELDRQAHRGERCSLYRRLHVDEFRHVLTTCVDDTFGLAVAATKRAPPEPYVKNRFRLGPRARPTH